MGALGRWAGITPVVVRLIIGGMMFVHGLEKLAAGPAGFGEFLGGLGLPAPLALAWAVTLLELVGGAMLIVGLLTRVVAGLMVLELIGAIVLVTGGRGLIGAEAVGYERDLAYIAGLLVMVLLGPGRPSVDHAAGLERAALTVAGDARGARAPARA
jgi:putative oxidoreductase